MQRLTWILSLVLGLTACGGVPLGAAPQAGGPENAQLAAPGQWLGGLALPAGSFIRADQSLIIGAGDNWVGRAVLDVGRDADAAYRFFLDNLTSQGWSVVTAVRGRQSLLVMTRQERTLTIEVTDPMLSAPAVYLTMAPRNAVVISPKKP